jgi:cytochrome c-type biogenesis protein CcmH/NrfG
MRATPRLGVSMALVAAVAGALPADALALSARDVLVEPLITALSLFVYAVLILAAIALVVLLRRGVRRALPVRQITTIAVEDLAAETSERQTSSYVLGRQLKAEIEAVESGVAAVGDTGIDQRHDLDGAGLVSLAVAAERVAGLDSFAADDSPIRFGPLSFSPRQLAYFAGSYFTRRPAFELVGSLSTQGTRAIVSVYRYEGGSRTSPLDRWQAVESGEGARERALAGVATQIAVAIGETDVSEDWNSFYLYRRAIETLALASEPKSRSEALAESQRLLQASLERDPSNLLARFQLATVLRRQGENDSAAEHFHFVQRLAASPPTDKPAVRRLLERNPNLALLARYNRAVALAKTDDPQCHRDAIRILGDLRKHLDAKEARSADESRLDMLVRTSRAAALVLRLERAGEAPREEAQRREWQRARLETFEEITSALRWIEGRTPDEVVDWTAYTHAQATAHNAFGRAASLLGKTGDALDALRTAAALLPDFEDAHINIASVLLQQHPRDWQTRAERHLVRALELAPLNRKAHYLLGQLYADEAVGRYEEAKEQFRLSGSDSQSCARLAELALREGNHAEAAELLRRSLALSNVPDRRLAQYLECVVELARSNGVDRKLLLEARTRAQRLVSKGKAPRLRKQGERLLADVEQLLAKGGSSSSPVQPDAAPEAAP